VIKYFLSEIFNKTELKLPAFVIETLRNEPLDQIDGVLECERAINTLMKVAKTKFEDGKYQNTKYHDF
jgi:hypothetical protein